MKLGLIGGSFDPIHRGHLQAAKRARERLGLERVIFLPTSDPPHKPDRAFAPALARYAMVELALLDEEGLYASPFELTPGRRAYTVDSVEHFRAQHPEAELWLLVGADSYLELPTWRRWRDLLRAARLCVLARPGWDAAAAGVEPELAERAAKGGMVLLDNEPLAASGTEIRRRLARGEEPPAGWMPEAVLHYCRKYRLYR